MVQLRKNLPGRASVVGKMYARTGLDPALTYSYEQGDEASPESAKIIDCL